MKMEGLEVTPRISPRAISFASVAIVQQTAFDIVVPDGLPEGMQTIDRFHMSSLIDDGLLQSFESAHLVDPPHMAFLGRELGFQEGAHDLTHQFEDQ